jgi:hypothetical protein
MGSWFARLAQVTQRRHAGRRAGVRPTLEGLEARCLLDAAPPIIPNLTPTPQMSVSTVPHNGDVNPYGVAFVPADLEVNGPLHPGDILVSNFNNSTNAQGTGTTIERINPNGGRNLFFQGPSTPGALGLTTALGVLRSGFVIVGSVPTLDGTSGTVQAPGSLLILNKFGRVVMTLTDATNLDGPWDLTINDQGSTAQVFVSNVLSGTVTRINLATPAGVTPIVLSETQIASGYLTRTDPAALLVGPTGLAYDAQHDLLYVASTGDNAIFSISSAAGRTTDAGMGQPVYQDNMHLHGPLGLVLGPNGDLVSSQGDAVNPDPNQPSELVEFTPAGTFVAQMPVNSSGQQGGAFGIAVASSDDQILFAAVDDIFNTLLVWKIGSGDKHDALLADPGHGADASAHLAADGPSAKVGSLSLLPGTDGANMGVTPRLSASTSAFVQTAHQTAIDLTFADLQLGLLE